MWLWPKDGWGKLDVGKVADDIAAMGCGWVIPQASLAAPWWIEKNLARLQQSGLSVIAGLGVDGAVKQPDAVTKITKAILAGIDSCGYCMVDWEGRWEGKQREALQIAENVVRQRPDVLDKLRLMDCPWWAPFSTPDGHKTHPRAPTKEWGKIVHLRFVQAYGAPKDGQSMWMWRAAVKQYADTFGESRAVIRPALQGYKRSAGDHVKTMLAADNGPIAIWDYLELDAEARLGLRVVKALHGMNYWGVNAVEMFQMDHGVKDQKPGGLTPDTLKALGL